MNKITLAVLAYLFLLAVAALSVMNIGSCHTDTECEVYGVGSRRE